MNLAELLAESRKLLNEGMSEQDVIERLNRKMPSSSPYDQPRYKCIACYDKGYVVIWSPADVARYVDGQKPAPTCQSTVDCSCKETDRHKYDPTKHCRIAIEHSRDESIRELDAWLERKNRIEHHPHYNHDFAEHA